MGKRKACAEIFAEFSGNYEQPKPALRVPRDNAKAGSRASNPQGGIKAVPRHRNSTAIEQSRNGEQDANEGSSYRSSCIGRRNGLRRGTCADRFGRQHLWCV